MMRRIKARLLMWLMNNLKPEVSTWNFNPDYDSMDEADPGQHDVISIHVDNGRHELIYDTFVSARARAWRKRNGEI